jgi:hypothetical protein
MNNSFTELYNSYSNIELLEIVKNPNNYQPDAVAAAENILKTRNISEHEFKTAEIKVAEAKSQTPYIQQLFKKYNDYFFSSNPTIHSLGWLNIIPLIFLLTAIYSVYSLIEKIPSCISKNDFLYLSIYILNLVAIAFILYLFIIQSKWFWILLFADKILGVFSNIKTFVIDVFHNIIDYSSLNMFINDFFDIDYVLNRSTNVFQILFSIAVIYYLNQTAIKDFYKIDENIKRKVVLVTSIIIGLAIIGEIYSQISYYNLRNLNLNFQI